MHVQFLGLGRGLIASAAGASDYEGVFELMMHNAWPSERWIIGPQPISFIVT